MEPDTDSLPITYPGSVEHQRLLRAMTTYHARQPWALAFIVFGSVARGDWDAFSDLDLDVVIADGVAIEPVAEMARLCEAIGERPALIAPRRGDDGDVILAAHDTPGAHDSGAALAEFSIRYHPLRVTSPNILSSMRLLWGRIDEQRIRAAGLANAQPPGQPLEVGVALAVRATYGGATALARGRLWSAVAALEETRGLLMSLFARAHGYERALRSFERHADEEVQAELARAACAWEPESIRAALLAACNLLDGRLDALTGGQALLTAGERAIVARTRARLLPAEPVGRR